ncbi:hypothetical protein ElyMa_004819700 [Elysia marginata]|uniref:Uncharacterized protein n=1 Tax=Elysia marginata TaxID=1093978 RepID=A0AAV4IL89_9GAST|nr:hypothetical protein ElyMa_004819700 [Elysia marginata]
MYLWLPHGLLQCHKISQIFAHLSSVERTIQLQELEPNTQILTSFTESQSAVQTTITKIVEISAERASVKTRGSKSRDKDGTHKSSRSSVSSRSSLTSITSAKLKIQAAAAALVVKARTFQLEEEKHQDLERLEAKQQRLKKHKERELQHLQIELELMAQQAMLKVYEEHEALLSDEAPLASTGSRSDVINTAQLTLVSQPSSYPSPRTSHIECFRSQSPLLNPWWRSLKRTIMCNCLEASCCTRLPKTRVCSCLPLICHLRTSKPQVISLRPAVFGHRDNILAVVRCPRTFCFQQSFPSFQSVCYTRESRTDQRFLSTAECC